MKKRSLDARMAQYHTLIVNASRHPKIKQQMEQYGYSELRILEGQSLLERVSTWQDEKNTCYSQRNALTAQMKNDIKELKALYMEHLAIARFAFRNDAYMESQLQLKGLRKKDWAGWSSQVFSFYTRLEGDELITMKKYGAKAEEIAQAKAMAEALTDMYQQKKYNAGDAQSATEKRNEVLKALSRWVADYKKVARVALQDDPQLMEALGIMVPSVI
ncbi:hypothetical protein [Catalinimonas niigatensis]|uniref:hypothetical protein n=1 Tax=Catalinimonas niigatensis TaxID=1397264 RepID=UPI002664E948|nr:hypothetical protein [Catalinimonas niigatensis]WPP49472.1 hypothetical protein PZB72_22640 [Catalinimonas niigatensis]